MQELRLARDRCQALAADLERSKADNVKLYEKMRFVQDYTQDRPMPRGKKVDPHFAHTFSSLVPHSKFPGEMKVSHASTAMLIIMTQREQCSFDDYL